MTSDKLWLFAWAAAIGPVPSMRAPTKSASGAAAMKQGFRLLPAPSRTSISLALRRVIAQEDPGTDVEAARGRGARSWRSGGARILTPAGAPLCAGVRSLGCG